MIEKTSVCFAIFPSGIKLLDISAQRIKRFIEKHREYKYIPISKCYVNNRKSLATRIYMKKGV